MLVVSSDTNRFKIFLIISTDENVLQPYQEDHQFTSASFNANDCFTRMILKFDLKQKHLLKLKIKGFDKGPYSLPKMHPGGNGVIVGKFYFELMLRFSGRSHPTDKCPLNLFPQDGFPLHHHYVCKKTPSEGQSMAAFFEVNKHQAKVFISEKKHFFPDKDVSSDSDNIGSLGLFFSDVSLSIMTMFMDKDAYQYECKSSPDSKKADITFFSPAYSLMPQANCRRLTEGQSKPRRQNLVLKTNGKSYDLSENGSSLMRTGLGYDNSMNLVSASTPIIPYHKVLQPEYFTGCNKVCDLIERAMDLFPPNVFSIPIATASLAKLFEELLEIQVQDIPIPPTLANADEVHQATYLLSVAMRSIAVAFGQLDSEESWLCLFERLCYILKKRISASGNALTTYFNDSFEIVGLFPLGVYEMCHKTYFLFSVLFPECRVMVLDGAARFTSCIHSNVGIPIPFATLPGGSVMDKEIQSNNLSIFPAPGPHFYLSKVYAGYQVWMFSTGAESFDSTWQGNCQRESQAYQSKQTSRGNNFTDWILGCFESLRLKVQRAGGPSFDRLKHGMDRFIPAIVPDDLNINLLQYLAPEGFKVFSDLSADEQRNVETWYNEKLPKVSIDKKEYVLEYNFKELRVCPFPTNLKSPDQTYWDRRRNPYVHPPLPALSNFPSLAYDCPGMSFNEIGSWYINLLQVFMATLFSIQGSPYLDHQLKEFFGTTSSPGENQYKLTVLYNNMYTLMFQARGGFSTTNIPYPHLNLLLQLVAMCLVGDHDQPESPIRVSDLKKMIDGSVPIGAKIFKTFIAQFGIPVWSPKVDEGNIFTQDGMLPHFLQHSSCTLPRHGYSNMMFNVSTVFVFKSVFA